ncbi:MAG: UPF0158 family protein [Treponema sp.]|nr:UPF0158 family protein [Treponema sp.]
MTFGITDKIVDDIIFAMENQNSLFVFDAEKNQVVAIDSEIVADDLVEQEKGYVLPVWEPEDGFKLLEDFTGTLQNAKIRAELRQILSNGRGVFKNFKNALKRYPSLERCFHTFKTRKMRSVVYDWYNSLRENWGLESFSFSQNQEDSNDLLRQDFQFSEYNPKEDADCIAREAGEIAEEIKDFYPEKVGLAIGQHWLRKFNDLISDSCGFVCRTTSDDFAGCLLFSLPKSIDSESCDSKSKDLKLKNSEVSKSSDSKSSDSKSTDLKSSENQNEAAFFTACFVNQNYRCMGIAAELFFSCVSLLKERGIHWFIIAETSVPEFLEPLLNRCGFEKSGSVYLAHLADN